jgi:uncharacterized membrane protein
MDFELFLGRFHPLVVNLPIGFIILAAILEGLNRLYKDKFNNLDTAISISLFGGGIGLVLSVLIGYLLSSGGGYDEQTLFWHQWLGIGLCIFTFFGWAVKVGRIKMPKNSASVIIGLLVLFISIIGHLGGNLTHGSDYLLTYAVAVATPWAVNYVVSQSFPIVMDSEVNNGATWNGSLPYFIFTIFIVIIMIVTYKFIPETKGKSLEEIEAFWKV